MICKPWRYQFLWLKCLLGRHEGTYYTKHQTWGYECCCMWCDKVMRTQLVEGEQT